MTAASNKDFLQSLASQVIRRVKRKCPFNNIDKNRWVEYCRAYQGDNYELALWERYLLGEINDVINRLTNAQMLRAYLNTPQGQLYLEDMLGIAIDIKYLNLKTLALEIEYNRDDLIETVMNILKTHAIDHD